MKRYAVFAVPTYYPGGGWNDFEGSFDNLEDALAKAKTWSEKYEWWHIVDITKMAVVEEKE